MSSVILPTLWICDCGLICRKITVWTCPVCGSGKLQTPISAHSLLRRYNELLSVAWKIRGSHPNFGPTTDFSPLTPFSKEPIEAEPHSLSNMNEQNLRNRANRLERPLETSTSTDEYCML